MHIFALSPMPFVTKSRFSSTVSKTLVRPEPPSEADNVVSFVLSANNTKDLPRKGWLRIGVKQPESVAAHSWSTSMLAMLLTPENMDVNKTIKYAMLHDLAEAYVGDITPYDGISPAEASQLETRAIEKLCEAFPRLKSTWMEYENKLTPEAGFCRQLDKLDMAIQALAYAKKGHNTQEFIESARKEIFHPRVKAVFDEVVRRINLSKHFKKNA